MFNLNTALVLRGVRTNSFERVINYNNLVDVENTVGVLRVVRTKSFERVINWLRLYIYVYRFETCGTVAFFVYDNPLSYAALGGAGGDPLSKAEEGDSATC